MRDGRSLKTRTVKNSKDPEFDEVMEFIVDDPEHQTITSFLRESDFTFSKVNGAGRGPAACWLACC